MAGLSGDRRMSYFPDTGSPAPPPPYPHSERTFNGRIAGVVVGILMFAAGVVGTWMTWRYFVGTAEGQLVDETALDGSTLGRSMLWRAAGPVLDVIDVPFVAVVLGAAALIAIVRRRWLLALEVAVLVAGSNLTTQILKDSVFYRDTESVLVGPAGNSLPSGHTTVAASVAAALVLVVPRSLRPLVAVVGAGYTALTGVSTMVGGWHRPSDVVAAICVVVAWAGLVTVIAAVGRPEHNPSALGTPVLFGVAALLVLASVITGALAASALFDTRDAVAVQGLPDGTAELAAAYVGGALGVGAVTSLAFAAILVAHHVATTSRAVPYR
jgi:membrane-associated phospholipid phosphatase